MKLTVLRFLIVALSCVCAVMVITNLRAPEAAENGKDFAPLYAALGMPQPAQTPAAAAQEQTIAQEGREKNVKLLGDLPVSQFIPVMNYFAASMGRRCNFCHVNNQGQWDYPSDAKPEKNTARAMIKLVLDTNKTLGGLKLDPIACYTCHRGPSNEQRNPNRAPVAADARSAHSASVSVTRCGSPRPARDTFVRKSPSDTRRIPPSTRPSNTSTRMSNPG